VTTTSATPERWARLIDDRSPGLTWLAATLLEWTALIPAERRTWRVTVTATRGGVIQALAALHEETGVLAVVAQPDAPTPFIGLPEGVRRLLGEPSVVEAVMEAVPELGERLLLSVRRSIHVSREHHLRGGDAEARRPRDPDVRKARDGEVAELERLRTESGADPDPMNAVDLAWATHRGHVWVLQGEGGIQGMFRVDGASLRHVQIADLVVPPRVRGKGVGTRVAGAAAQVAREEYAGSAVAAVLEGVAGRATFAAAGYEEVGSLDDVRLRS
jgi:hypothetical protein